MMKVHIFHTGSVRVDQAIPYKEKNPLAVTGLFRSAEKKLVLPVSCYLIEHPSGLVMIDSGWDTKWANEKPSRYFGLLNSMSTPIIRSDEGVDSCLSSLGYKPSDIDYLFFSHMDFDHTSGLRLLKGVKNILASREELEDSRKYFYRYVKSDWAGFEIRPFDYTDSGIGPVGRSYDVFSDGRLLLVNTPGHSHGHFSAVISNEGRYVVLAGDSVYTQRSIKERIIPGFTVDDELARKSVDWICSCSEDRSCLLVAPDHDPSITPQTIEL